GLEHLCSTAGFDDIVFESGALRDLESLGQHGGMEEGLGAVLGDDETEALVGIEPFHASGGHDVLSSHGTRFGAGGAGAWRRRVRAWRRRVCRVEAVAAFCPVAPGDVARRSESIRSSRSAAVGVRIGLWRSSRLSPPLVRG